jgi:hypothetical protein
VIDLVKDPSYFLITLVLVPVLGVIFKTAYDHYVKWHYPDPKKYWEKRKKIVDVAAERIRRERHNFQKIKDKKTLSSKGEIDAVMVASFDLLIKDIEPLIAYRRFRRLTNRVLKEARSQQEARTKDVVRLMSWIDDLEKKLVHDKSHVM